MCVQAACRTLANSERKQSFPPRWENLRLKISYRWSLFVDQHSNKQLQRRVRRAEPLRRCLTQPAVAPRRQNIHNMHKNTRSQLVKRQKYFQQSKFISLWMAGSAGGSDDWRLYLAAEVGLFNTTAAERSSSTIVQSECTLSQCLAIDFFFFHLSIN